MNGKMVVGIIGGAVALFLWLHHSSTFAADWQDPDWDAVVEQSQSTGYPAVVLFTADWCPSCRALHANVLSRPDVQDELHRHYIFYVVDLSSPLPQAQIHSRELGVQAIPTLIRFDAHQQETSRTHGMDPAQMIAWLKAGE